MAGEPELARSTACMALQRHAWHDCGAGAGKGRADDGVRHSGYYKTWGHLSGPLCLVRSAWHGPTVISLPRRERPGRVAAPLRDGALVYSPRLPPKRAPRMSMKAARAGAEEILWQL